MAERTDDRNARRPIASRAGVRILLGVAAAALAVGALAQRRGEPTPEADAASLDVGRADVPTGLAPDPRVRADSGLRGEAPGGGRPAGADSRPVASAEDPPLPPHLRRLRGRVVFPSERPPTLEVSLARLRNPGEQPSRYAGAWLSTDGSFESFGYADSETYVDVQWDHQRVRFGPLAPWQVGTDAPEVRFELGTATLEGRLLDADGKAVRGVTVRDRVGQTSLASFPSERTTTTDEDGRWRLDHLAPGRHALESRRPSPVSKEWDLRWEDVVLAAGEHRTLDFGFAPTDATWTGTLRLRNGAPLPGPGHLFLTREGTSAHTRVTYDATGRFHMSASVGRYTVTVEPRGPRRGFLLDLPATLRPPKVPPAPPDAILLDHDVEADVTLAGGTVAGRVLGIAPPAPTRDSIRVAFHPAAATGQGAVDPTLEDPGAEGRFTAHALPPGRYAVTGWLSGGTVDLVGPDGRPVVVDVVDGGEIAGLELRVARP